MIGDEATVEELSSGLHELKEWTNEQVEYLDDRLRVVYSALGIPYE